MTVELDSPPLTRIHKLGIVALAVAALGFGALVEFRSAWLTHRRTDFDVFLRAAWAIRNGQDFYSITDPNGWHYHYPPLFAMLLMPLADPPAGKSRAGYLPFGVSIAIWYALNLIFVVVAVHLLARALEKTGGYKWQPYSQRWWELRAIPFFTCIVPIGHTLARGETNLLLLLLLSFLISALFARQSMRAGGWLSAAVTLKMFPAYLLVLPAWRRDWKMSAAALIGLLTMFVLIPVAWLGPSRTIDAYAEWNRALIQPALVGGADQSRARELIEMTATESQSFQNVIHNTLHPNHFARPPHPAPAVRVAHWMIGVALTIVAIAVAGSPSSASEEMIFYGLLIVVMILLSPVCHLHYFCMMVPLVMGLTLWLWERGKTLDLKNRWTRRLIFFAATTIAANWPGTVVPRDFGVVMYGALSVWIAVVIALWRDRRGQSAQSGAMFRAAG